MNNLSIATVGGGCFWCIEAVLQRLKGVEKVESGYTGGHSKGVPSYREVCSGTTGHAEVVRVSFDPELISYHDLISIFMTSHDPTQLNGQGADIGTQYRSVIYYHSDEQKQIAEQVFEELAEYFPKKIVTELSAAEEFYIAEAYHQDYYNNNAQAGYCRVVIDPKLRKLRDHYADRLQEVG